MPRLPELVDREQLPASTQPAFDYIAKSRGRVSSSYAVMLHAPEMTRRICHLGTKLRFESTLDNLTIELIALTASSELDNPYESTLHARAAADLGVEAGLIAAIRSKCGLPDSSANITLPVACARELIRTHQLSDALFEAAHQAFGDQGAVELIGTIGFYAMLAFTHNALQVRVPLA